MSLVTATANIMNVYAQRAEPAAMPQLQPFTSSRVPEENNKKAGRTTSRRETAQAWALAQDLAGERERDLLADRARLGLGERERE